MPFGSPRTHIAAVLLTFTALAFGCAAPAHMDKPEALSIAGPIAIDVESFGGDVVIETDPDLVDTEVRVKREAVHGPDRRTEAEQSLDAISWSADVVPGELGPVLQIRTTTIDPEPHFQRAHVTVRGPDIEGIRIRTSDGDVIARGIRGAVDIETSYGNVRVMTNERMNETVTIANMDGDIDYRVRGESTARFDCEAIRGLVAHRVRHGTLVVRAGSDDHTLHADLNDGENPVTLRTTDGDIRIAVVGNPMEVGTLIVSP